MDKKIRSILICGILFIALCGGLRIPLGLPSFITVLSEIFIYLLLIVSLIARSGRNIYFPHMWYCVVSIFMIAGCSIILNEIDFFRALFSLRLLFRFYFFYVAITFIELSDENLKKINYFIAVLLVFQFPVVAVKFYHYGIAERTLGAYPQIDGSLSATVPVMVLFFSAAFYLLYRPDFRYILVAIGFIVLSIVGDKRAVFFMYPLQFIAIYYYIYSKGRDINLTKKIGALSIVLFSVIVLTSSILYFSKTLNPEGRVGGRIDYGYALSYAQGYNVGEDGYGYTYGRISTTIRVFESLWDSGIERFLLGFGPGFNTPSLFESRKEKEQRINQMDEFMILYGWTPMTKIVFEYGIFAGLLYTLILLTLSGMCWKYYNSENDPYWKAFAAGSVGFSFSMLFFFFAYHSTAIWGDTLPALYFYAMAVVYTRRKRILAPVYKKIKSPTF
jgi:hypothetical protein